MMGIGCMYIAFCTKPRRAVLGFTLIELLVVLAMVALLLTIAMPRYFSSVEKTKDAVLRENLKVLRLSLDTFQADKGRRPVSLVELVEHKYLRSIPIDPVTESAATWVLLPSSEADQDGIIDVRSGAPGAGVGGLAYEAY
jgi:general secretion pathway protein G